MPTTLEAIVATALATAIGGTFTVVRIAIRSLQWQLREAHGWAEASEKRANEYARMALELISQRSSVSRHSGPR